MTFKSPEIKFILIQVCGIHLILHHLTQYTDYGGLHRDSTMLLSELRDFSASARRGARLDRLRTGENGRSPTAEVKAPELSGTMRLDGLGHSTLGHLSTLHVLRAKILLMLLQVHLVN